ncbi:MAG: lysylphosphatidylglycerol synthase domain-containing protein, partial [Bradyrhizobium sp.]
MRRRRTLRLLLHPKFLLPVLLAAALLTVAFKLGDLGSVLARVQAIPLWVMALALAAAIVYLALKCWQFHHLLANLGLHPNRRRLLLAFGVGELAVTLPFGIFAQNWVLSTTGKAHFGRSSAATIIMILTETLVVLLFLAVVGIPGWPELRPLAIVFAVGLVVVVFGSLRFGHIARRIGRKTKQPVLRQVLSELVGLLRGLKRLSNLRLLAFNLLIAAAYLGALAFAFTVVGRGVGVHHLSYLTAA